MEKIGRCPYCGSEDGLVVQEAHFDCRLSSEPENQFWVLCTGDLGSKFCNARGPVKGSKKAAIEAWNTPAIETARLRDLGWEVPV